MEVRGASALVTGATRGIGRAISLALARDGAAVTAVGRDENALRSLVAEIGALGSRGSAFAGDLRDRATGAAAVEAAVAHGAGLQILVNNAGVGAFRSVEETSDQQWDDVLATNLTAVFRVTRAAIPHLVARGGHVVMISSLAAATPKAGMACYATSKAALDHFAGCLLAEVRQRGVRVTTVAPGSVDTAFRVANPTADRQWMLTPDDVARVVLEVLRTRDGAAVSRVEVRPARQPEN